MEPSERLAAAAARLAEAYREEIDHNGGRWTAASPIATAISRSDAEVAHAVAECGRLAVLTFNSALDHLTAMSRLLASPDVILSVATVTRGALEAAAMTHYLMEPGVTPAERARRQLNERLETLTETRLLAERTGQRDEAAQRRLQVDGVLDTARRLGLTAKVPKQDWQAPSIGERPGATEKVQQLLADRNLGKIVYKVLSATAHAAVFGIAQYLVVLDDPELDEDSELVSAVIGITSKEEAMRYSGAPLGVVNAGERLFAAFGWDHGRMSLRVQMSLAAWMDVGEMSRRDFRASVDRALSAQNIPASFRKDTGTAARGAVPRGEGRLLDPRDSAT